LPCALERLAVIEAGAPVREAAALMSKPHTDLIVVCDHGDMVGVLTKTDIVGQTSRCMSSGCTARVDSIMTRDVTYCRTHEALLDVWSLMRERGLQRVPILDEARRPLGIIYAREALQALLSERRTKTSCFATTYPGSGIGKTSGRRRALSCPPTRARADITSI
jgi:CBS domain-containing protein